MSILNKPIFLAVFVSLIGIVGSPAAAVPITISNPFNFVDNVSNNSIGLITGVREQFGATNVTPNGSGGTTGTATRDGISRDLNFIPFDLFPNFFTRTIAYNPGTTATGAFTLNFQNGGDTAQAVTPDIVGASVVPFVNSVMISGTGATPRFNWSVPSTFAPDGTLIRIRDTTDFRGTAGVGGNGVANIIFSRAFSPGTTSFAVDANVLSLAQNRLYSIEIDLLDTRDNTFLPRGLSNILSQSRAFFDFSLLSANAPPDVFLPTLVAGAVPFYQFNISNIIGGERIFIDPLVATGYTYSTGLGDPNFASVLLPLGIGDDLFRLFLWNGTDFVDSMTNLIGGIEYFFASGGVDRFQIQGIETSAGLDPNNTTAFITGLTFTGNGQFTGTQTPLTTNVPEPATLALLGFGLAGMGFMRRKA